MRLVLAGKQTTECIENSDQPGKDFHQPKRVGKLVVPGQSFSVSVPIVYSEWFQNVRLVEVPELAVFRLRPGYREDGVYRPPRRFVRPFHCCQISERTDIVGRQEKVGNIG